MGTGNDVERPTRRVARDVGLAILAVALVVAVVVADPLVTIGSAVAAAVGIDDLPDLPDAPDRPDWARWLFGWRRLVVIAVVVVLAAVVRTAWDSRKRRPGAGRRGL